MKTVLLTGFLGCILLLSPVSAQAQSTSVQQYARPAEKMVDKAKAIVADSIFARLKAGKNQELSEWIVAQTGYSLDSAGKIKKINEFLAQFESIMLKPPAGPFGALEGYELLQESPLPGSERYFRLTYLSLHSHAPLVWEFQFYITHNNDVKLNIIMFNGGNPFQYLSSPDMLLNQFYN